MTATPPLKSLDAAKLKAWRDDFVREARSLVPGVTDKAAENHFDLIVNVLNEDFAAEGTRLGQYKWEDMVAYEDSVAKVMKELESKLPNDIRQREANMERLLWSDSNIGKLAVSKPEVLTAMGIAGDKLWLEGSAMGKLLEQFERSGKGAFGPDDFAKAYGDRGILSWKGVSKNFAAGAVGKVAAIMPVALNLDSTAFLTEIGAIKERMQPNSDQVKELRVYNLDPRLLRQVQECVDQKPSVMRARLKKALDTNPPPSPEKAAELQQKLAPLAAMSKQEMDKADNAVNEKIIGLMKRDGAWKQKDHMDAIIKIPPPKPEEIRKFLSAEAKGKLGAIGTAYLMTKGKQLGGEGISLRAIANRLNPAEKAKRARLAAKKRKEMEKRKNVEQHLEEVRKRSGLVG